MSEEIKIIDGTYKKDDPHQDIGKQKFRVRKHIQPMLNMMWSRIAKTRQSRLYQSMVVSNGLNGKKDTTVMSL